MGLADLFHRAGRARSFPETDGFTDAAREPEKFVMGAEDRFAVGNSGDLVVVGTVRGTVRAGDAVQVFNFGDDDAQTFSAAVDGIETGLRQKAAAVTDGRAALRIKSGARLPIRCGTVLCAAGTAAAEMRDAYAAALGAALARDAAYLLRPASAQGLSATDCAELLRIFRRQSGAPGGAAANGGPQTGARLEGLLREKLLAAGDVSCVFSTATDEPYLFSQTFAKDGAYRCAPPVILLITKAYRKILSPQYAQDGFEVRKIPAADGGLSDFLGAAFYLDGAQAAAVNFLQAALPGRALAAPPDPGGVPPVERPVMNPDLERWLLLMAQLGRPQTPDAEKIAAVYTSLMGQELLKANLLIPMKHKGNIPAPDASGKTVVPAGVEFSLATIKGKGDRPAVRMFTDWKRLRAAMGADWEGLIQPVGGMIEKFDCAVNLTAAGMGCYISKEVYELFSRKDDPPAPDDPR
ncbi:MAG: hypothetical protein VB021_04415 [Oscillospiraceae bacterium]|nr:hypothetical protein [Oscillospiraceae bacterium]